MSNNRNLAFVEVDLTDESVRALKVLRSVGPIRCDRCRHWDPDLEDRRDEYGLCQKIDHPTLDVAVPTKPDFGCALFEPRESEGW